MEAELSDATTASADSEPGTPLSCNADSVLVLDIADYSGSVANGTAQPSNGSLASTSAPQSSFSGSTHQQGTGKVGAGKVELVPATTMITSVNTQIFRPIRFESTPATPATTEGNGSESGSDSALDSAYSSDNAQSLGLVAAAAAGIAPPFCKKITASLQNKSLWKSFKRIGNEMIVTKPGR